MGDAFYFLDYDIQEIQKKRFLCIYILDLDKKVIFRIFKQYNDKLLEFLNEFSCFTSFNDYLHFVIKRDGKISLDIKFWV